MHVLVHFFLEAARESHFGKFRAREKDLFMNSLGFEFGFVAVRVVNIGSNCLQLRYVKEVCRQGLWENQSGIWRVHSTPDLLLCQEMQLKGRCSYKEGYKGSLTSKAISNKGFVQRSEGIGQRGSENNTSPRARATDNTLTVQTDEKVLRRTICELSLRDYGRVVEGLPFRVKDALPTRHAIVCRR